jgi:nicotinamide-nucleotide amidase
MTARAPALQKAEVIAVGTEMLSSTRVDTNSLYLAERLSGLGIDLRAKTVVGDNRREVAEHLRRALERVDLVIVTGGLGPTDDDVTRDALADVLGLPLVEHPAIVERLVQRFARRGLAMPAVNRRQALVIRGGVVLENPNGTAPGQMVDVGQRLVVLLPGPPREIKPMMDALVSGPLAARAGPDRLFRTTLFAVGRGESHVEELVQPIYSRWLNAVPPIETTILAAPGQIELHLVTRSAAAAAEAALAAARDELLAVLGADVFSVDGRSMEEIVGQLLLDRKLTIAAAESCTGGLMLSRLTDIPGSSAYVLGGIVAYSNPLKVALAGVPATLIDTHGAVSEPVAAALAEGIRARTGAALGVGITGIAGPAGGTPQKPVGTVAIAVARADQTTRVRTFSLFGSRTMVKFQASQMGLDMVRRVLLESASGS